jgi:hypothetical protein
VALQPYDAGQSQGCVKGKLISEHVRPLDKSVGPETGTSRRKSEQLQRHPNRERGTPRTGQAAEYGHERTGVAETYANIHDGVGADTVLENCCLVERVDLYI